MDKTYTIRQVSTSNEVYLTQAIPDLASLPPRNRLEAIAKCDSTLELQQAENVSAVPYIKAALPSYITTGHYDSEKLLSKRELFANIPLSDGECEQAWNDLACFELDGRQGQGAVIPSDSVRLKVWQDILCAAICADIDLTGRLEYRDEEVIARSAEMWPWGSVRAVLASFAVPLPEDDGSGFFELDKDKCARTMGEFLLREHTDNGRIPASKEPFLWAWADLLPEDWRGRADLRLLEGSHRLEHGGEAVVFVESNETNGVAASTGAPNDANSTLGAKRKWHEKFRAAKKAA